MKDIESDFHFLNVKSENYMNFQLQKYKLNTQALANIFFKLN